MTHLTWSLGLFTALVEASHPYMTIPREELEPLFEEIKGWLHQQDSVLLQQPTSSVLATGKHHGRQTTEFPVFIGRYR